MRIIIKHIDIKLGQITQEELDSVLRKSKIKKKEEGLMKYPRSMEDQAIQWHTTPTL